MLSSGIHRICFVLALTSFLPPLTAFSLEFKDGVHLKNKDTRPYSLKYSEPLLTTAICDVRKPAGRITQGLDSAFLRAPVKGLEIVSSKLLDMRREVRARVSANASIDCLCVAGCEIEIENFPLLKVKSGQTVIIKDGKAGTR